MLLSQCLSFYLLTYYLKNAFPQCSAVPILPVFNLCHSQEVLLILLLTSTQRVSPAGSSWHLPITAYYHVNSNAHLFIYSAAVSYLCLGFQVWVLCPPLLTLYYCPRLIFCSSVCHMTASQDLWHTRVDYLYEGKRHVNEWLHSIWTF